jgi:hypothetical protein
MEILHIAPHLAGMVKALVVNAVGDVLGLAGANKKEYSQHGENGADCFHIMGFKGMNKGTKICRGMQDQLSVGDWWLVIGDWWLVIISNKMGLFLSY